MEQLAARFGDGRREVEVGLDLPEGADDTHAREVLRNVPGVESLDDGPRPGDPWTLTVAPGSDPAAVRSAVLAVVAAEGLPLASIRAVLPSLEDVYRRAVARPATAGAVRPRPTPEDAPPEGERGDLDRAPAAAVTPTARVVAPDPIEPVTLPSETPSTEDER